MITLVVWEGKLYSTFLTLLEPYHAIHVYHHTSYIMHHDMYFIMLSKASFITCSLYEREKTRVDQVSELVHPLEVLVSIRPL
jgi:hypothetical protein